MRSVLVTGGAGFIGCNFVRFLLDAEPDVRVVNLDLLTYAGSLENLRDLPGAERHTFVRGDVADRSLVDRLLREHDVDTIVHFAAESHVDRSIAAPGRFIDTNIIGTFTLLEAARGAWLAADRPVRFHHVSTDEVFGSLAPDDPSFHERTPYDPRSPYAASKAASDHLVRAYAHTYGLPVTISNCTNNYGPYQFPEKLIPLMILNALEGRPLPVYGDGRQVRDWLYVGDHCDALLRILRHGRPGETYGVGGDNQPTNLEIVERLCVVLDELRPESPHRPHFALVQYVADRPGHDRRYAMNTGKVRAELGWSPYHTLDAGLRRTVAWYLDQPAWLAAVRRQPGYHDWMQQNYATRG